MGRVGTLKPVYVQYIPSSDSVKEGELYISLEFQTAVHKCCCGCGEEVVTPFNSAQWQITDKSGKVSLYPSIGNWSYPCQSHYFINDNRVVWAEAFSDAAIKRVQARDQRALASYIANKNAASQGEDRLLQQLFAALLRYARKVLDLIYRKR
ncbi:MAG: hypothetical protein EP334_10655 [Gammaproteobacteria bacterium]|nr:MAG: hypothetical protein EP334_10655 [Gammaproteobacteria bacterium]